MPTANYLKIPDLIDDLIIDINKKSQEAIALASKVHAKFEQIHPFSDGNGRVGRLLMLAMLVKAKLATAIIIQNLKSQYYNYLNKTQAKEEFSQLENFICDAQLVLVLILQDVNKKQTRKCLLFLFLKQ